MRKSQYSDKFVAWIRSQRMSKRAAEAREIMLERGTVTTGELNRLGYDHPPRVIGDLKDAGVTVARRDIRVDGRRMAEYTLLDVQGGDEVIRRQLPKAFRESLYKEHDYRCAVCGGDYSSRELQTDHRVPFRIGGDPKVLRTEDFMPLCGSDNRAKSWTCEHCPNWTLKNVATCNTCYWASPDSYEHIATIEERRLTVTVRGDRVAVFDSVVGCAAAEGVTPGEWVVTRLDVLLVDPSKS